MTRQKTSKTYRGAWIPAKVLSLRNISLLDKVILADIAYFDGKDGYCFSYPAIAQKFGIGRMTVIRAVERLCSPKLGMIHRTGDEYHRRLTVSEEIAALFSAKGKPRQATTINKPTISAPKEYIETSQEFCLAKLLFDEIQNRKPDFKQPNLQVWARHIDLMIRQDSRTPERIREVVLWCQGDSGNGSWAGWQNNILSTKKLREKFDKLELSMGRENADSRSNQPVKEFIR